jgi:DNA recombination protein Rad52
MNWETVSAELAKPLNPDAIKPPPQGKYGEYVEALHVIREANRIFGYDGWRYDVKQLSLTNATTNEGKHRIGYFAIVEVKIDDVTRSDVGHGQGFGKSEGDAHDSAVKEAVTDALKRALRTFGNTFGLALYEKDRAAREVGYSVTDEDRAEAIEWVNRCETMDALVSMWGNLNQARKHVAADPKVIAAKDARKLELDQKEVA